MDLIYITNNILRAEIAQHAGVDRIMIDLEINGKVERQGHLNTVISRHTLKDVRNLRGVLRDASLMVRVNPIFPGSREEIERCIDLGVDILMLPMFTTAREVEQFISMIDGKARVCLLLETGQALARANDILNVVGIDEVHLGLNDLHIALKLTFMFELLSGGLVDHFSNILQSRNIKFGFGGVARLNRGPLSSNMILIEHARLGSTQVILSRDFNQVFETVGETGGIEGFCEEIRLLREFIIQAANTTELEYDINSAKVRKVVQVIVGNYKNLY